MKQKILVVLMVLMVFTPSLAQEVVPESMLSIDGTLWGNYLVELRVCELPLFSINDSTFTGYHQGTVYNCHTTENLYCSPDQKATYINSPLLAVAFSPLSRKTRLCWYTSTALLQPRGFGITFSFGYCLGGCLAGGGVGTQIGFMFKVEDDWVPPEVE